MPRILHKSFIIAQFSDDCRKKSRDCFGFSWFSHYPFKWPVITLPIRKKKSIGVGLTSKSSWIVKPSVALVLVVSRHLVFKVTDLSGFTFAPH